MSGLKISRQVGQSVMVGDCLVTIEKIKGKTVHLVFQAPRSLPIHRVKADESKKPVGCKCELPNLSLEATQDLELGSESIR
jgi:hypothetical protein